MTFSARDACKCAAIRVQGVDQGVGYGRQSPSPPVGGSGLKLTAKEVEHAGPGMHGDGKGPRAAVMGAPLQAAGQSPRDGLGELPVVSLAEARDKALATRKLIGQGIDPIDQREMEQSAAETEEARATTFAEAAEAYIAAHEAGWRSAIHARQWRSSIRRYAAPLLGGKACSAIETDDILRTLKPVWTKKPETGSRLRGRLEMILSYATARGWRDGLNPAVWRGHLQLMLPSRSKIAPVALRRARLARGPAFMAKLRTREGMGARTLEFAILTAARSGEVRGARWGEIDLDRAVWTIPAARA